ncbi:MAG: hypothetical protein ACRYG8_10135 [Janthinobacterium lividum]
MLREFRRAHNPTWLVERQGFSIPEAVRQDSLSDVALPLRLQSLVLNQISDPGCTCFHCERFDQDVHAGIEVPMAEHGVFGIASDERLWCTDWRHIGWG